MDEIRKNEEFSEDIEYVGRIKMQYASLSKAQKRIANYILNHREAVIHYSITTMAQKTGTVPSTVTRFCQALSYKGFSELKVYMEKNLASPLAMDAPIQKGDTIQVVIQKLMNTFQNAVSDTMRTLDGKALTRVVDAILNAKNIVFFGQSGGSISTLFAQQLLLRINILSQTVSGQVDMNLAASTLGKGDVAIGIAYSGEVRSVTEAMTTAKHNKATVIAITANPSSSMGKLADLKLFYSYNIPDDLQYLHLASMCELAIIGAIQAEILRRPMQLEKIDACKKAVLASRIK
ncbi:MAG: MurR/RpiR family transcriptional regulator [Lachnospiraceae bacterium]|jgi:DNA-binding MurR/RpiR family transcriptional regulator|nr:MurR/RpiR family transcriptional regulator [Lachnospiraceae bacterium]